MKLIIAALSCLILSINGHAQNENTSTSQSTQSTQGTEVKSETADLKDSKIKNIKKAKEPKAEKKQKEESVVTTTSTTSEKATKETKVSDRVTIVMETSIDPTPIEIELYGKEAPVSVANFLKYVDEGFYDGLIFHRVIPEFMIQGGGMTPDMKEKSNHAPIKNEATNGLKNERGSIAMARTNIPDSATSQFFINTKDNSFLNHRAPTMSDYGYAVFGKVSKGMEVVDKIERVTTTRKGMHENVPAQPVIIKKVTRKTAVAQ